MNEHIDALDMVRREARRFLADAAQPAYLKHLLERPGSFDRQTWERTAELGWSATAHAEVHGGLGLGWAGLCVLAEELGRVALSLPLVQSAALAELVLGAGNATLAALVGQALVSGEAHACLALNEAGESGLSCRPAMRLVDGALLGATALVAFGASAAYALVCADQDGVLQLACVALDQPGVLRTPVPAVDNSRAVASLAFDGAKVHVLASGAAATSQLWRIAGMAALATAFEQLGGAQACLDMARDYALGRKAFGQVIGRFQSIKAKLADMYIRVEIARGCAIDALAALEQGDSGWSAMAAGARIGATDAYEIAARENIQTHGAIGVTWEAMPHHHYRRSRSLAVELGSSGAWRERLLAEAGFDCPATSDK